MLRVRRNDALRITDPDAEPSGPSWAQLVSLSDERVVIVSLAVLASAINRTCPRAAVLKVRLPRDKPPCAAVREASFITRGFALDDVFWYGWYDPARDSYVQRCLARTPMLRRFCQANDLAHILTSEADTDYGSGHPLCLYRAGRSGFLLGIDIEPPPKSMSATAVSPYGDRLLRQALGQAAPLRGQYTAAPRCRQEFEQTMAGMGDRFAGLRWVPTHSLESNPPLGWVETVMQPGEPVRDDCSIRRIGIRTGFSAGEWDLVWGVATFLKQLVTREDVPDDTGDKQGRRRFTMARACANDVSVRWTPIVRPQAVPPPAGAKEYTYMIDVPMAQRRRPPEQLSRPHVRIDVRRAQGPRVVVRTTASAPRRRAFGRQLAGLTESLDVAVRLDRSSPRAGSVEKWELGFPVEPRPHAYDAITAADRVIEVLDAVFRVQ